MRTLVSISKNARPSPRHSSSRTIPPTIYKPNRKNYSTLPIISPQTDQVKVNVKVGSSGSIPLRYPPPPFSPSQNYHFPQLTDLTTQHPPTPPPLPHIPHTPLLPLQPPLPRAKRPRSPNNPLPKRPRNNRPHRLPPLPANPLSAPHPRRPRRLRLGAETSRFRPATNQPRSS